MVPKWHELSANCPTCGSSVVVDSVSVNAAGAILLVGNCSREGCGLRSGHSLTWEDGVLLAYFHDYQEATRPYARSRSVH